MRRVFKGFAVVALTWLLLVGKAASAEPASSFSPQEFAQLSFLEGRWSGAMPDGTVFYESYAFEGADTLRSRRFARPDFADQTDTSTIQLSEGRIIVRWGRYSWRATDVSPSGAAFVPIDAPSAFRWRAIDGDTLEVVQSWTDAQGAPQSYTLRLARYRN